MKRDWDVIRDVLMEVEALNPKEFESIDYSVGEDETQRSVHAVLLWKAGFIEGANASSADGESIIANGLTWSGHELLETMRSKPVWESIKATAQDKGIELTFDAVKTLGKIALSALIGA